MYLIKIRINFQILLLLFTCHQYLQFDQIMSWWSSKLSQLLLQTQDMSLIVAQLNIPSCTTRTSCHLTSLQGILCLLPYLPTPPVSPPHSIIRPSRRPPSQSQHTILVITLPYAILSLLLLCLTYSRSLLSLASSEISYNVTCSCGSATFCRHHGDIHFQILLKFIFLFCFVEISVGRSQKRTKWTDARTCDLLKLHLHAIVIRWADGCIVI